MKKIISLVTLLSLSSTIAMAGFDLGQLSKLDGKSGTGTSAYEEGSFNCHIEVDTSANTLTIVQPDAYYSSQAMIQGDEVIKATNSAKGTLLITDERDLDKSGLCGDFFKAKSVSEKLQVNGNTVAYSISYRCGLVPHTDTTTCRLTK